MKKKFYKLFVIVLLTSAAIVQSYIFYIGVEMMNHPK